MYFLTPVIPTYGEERRLACSIVQDVLHSTNLHPML